MAGSLTALSAHRFGRAREELQTAELLLKNANFRSSINRSYYAIFHAIRAVNALDGCIKVKTPSTIRIIPIMSSIRPDADLLFICKASQNISVL